MRIIACTKSEDKEYHQRRQRTPRGERERTLVFHVSCEHLPRPRLLWSPGRLACDTLSLTPVGHVLRCCFTELHRHPIAQGSGVSGEEGARLSRPALMGKGDPGSAQCLPEHSRQRPPPASPVCSSKAKDSEMTPRGGAGGLCMGVEETTTSSSESPSPPPSPNDVGPGSCSLGHHLPSAPALPASPWRARWGQGCILSFSFTHKRESTLPSIISTPETANSSRFQRGEQSSWGRVEEAEPSTHPVAPGSGSAHIPLPS